MAALARRDLRRAAVRLWIAPFEAALSSARAASRAREVAVSASPSVAAARTFFVAVFNAVRTALFRSVRFAFVLFRLICDLMLAIRPRSLPALPWRTLSARTIDAP